MGYLRKKFVTRSFPKCYSLCNRQLEHALITSPKVSAYFFITHTRLFVAQCLVNETLGLQIFPDRIPRHLQRGCRLREVLTILVKYMAHMKSHRRFHLVW